MAMHNAMKRKRAGGGEQEPSKQNQEKQLKGKSAITVRSGHNGKKERAKATEDGGGSGEEDEDGDNDELVGKDSGDGDGDGDGDYDDNHSQKQRMMLFEKELKAIKQQKRSKFDSSTSKFRMKVKAREEEIIKSLKEQRLHIKLEASTFSKTFTALLNDASSYPFNRLLAGSPINSQDLVQHHQLYAPQASIKAISTRLLTSAQSLQTTLTTIAGRELTLGGGWEQDGDLSISALRESQRSALLKLTEIISKDSDGKTEGTKGTEEMTWGYTVKKSEKGIKRLLGNVPVPITSDIEDW